MGLPQGFRREVVTVGDSVAPVYVTVLTAAQARAMRELLAQVVALLRGDLDHHDPAIARLFPAVYSDDAEAAAELRHLTEEPLRAGKETTALHVIDTIPEHGGETCLTSEEAHTWLLALTDMRLIIGTRLGLDDDTDLVSELDDAVAREPNGPRVQAITIYHYTSFLQESLVNAISSELEAELAAELEGRPEDE